jgi:tRNA modification GTPase
MSELNLSDTIVAVSTAIGEAGIGIVRLSGPKSLSIADRIFKPASLNGRRYLKPSQCKSHTIHYGWIVNSLQFTANSLQKKQKGQHIIDEVLLTLMRAPKTYTREDIVEINCHSGIVPLKKILNLCLKQGARLAEPGEFTKRAFLNGRVDLAQAESVLEIVRTKSEAYHQSCLNRLTGNFSRQINYLSAELFDIISQCEAQIDFPQEDIEHPVHKLTTSLEKIKHALLGLLKSTRESKVIRDGISVAIAGRPNVGKSSLLNALLSQERALVTPFAGTTRDAIEEGVCFDGLPLRLIDTAGLRQTKHPVEQEATRRTHQIISAAQLILLVFDGSKPATKKDIQFVKRFKKQKNIIAILNKIDLPLKFNSLLLKGSFGNLNKISALKGTGLEALKQKIVKHIWRGKLSGDDYQFIANARQEELLDEALKSIVTGLVSLKAKFSLEIVVEDLKAALTTLHKLCGRYSDIEEELLDKIFSQFCIGK